MRVASILFCCFVALQGIVAPQGSAAVITGTFTAVSDSDFDLTAMGTDDWAYWNTTSDPATGGPKTNEKAGGTLISNMSPVGGGNVRGSGSSTRPVYDFIFSDGTSPVNGTVDNAIGLFNTQLNTVGAGVSLDVDLPTTTESTIYVWAGAYDGTGLFTASLPGAIDFTDTTLTGDGVTPKESGLYTLLVTPDNPNDTLNLSFVLGQSTGGNANMLISGVAVSVAPAVPEPSTFALAALGLFGLGWFGWRRQRRNV